MTPPVTSRSTILEVILSLEECTDLGARFVARNGDAIFFTYSEVRKGALRVASDLQQRGVRNGDVIGIILPTSIDFLQTFLGVQLAGGIPTALYPPFRLGKLDEYFSRTSRMLNRVESRLLITDRRTRTLLGPVVQQTTSLKDVVDVSELGEEPDRWLPVGASPDDIAFLQFSSGTTVEPKAVQISHRNLLANLDMMNSFLEGITREEAQNGAVCWLPLYHDMGLVGCMYMGLYHPGTVTYIGPDTFISRPRIWLQTLSRYKGVISPAPDFAYGLCLSRIKDEDMEGLDLSNWKFALNGAEPISTAVMEQFVDRFSRWGFRKNALTPVYGLAEAVLGVSFSDPEKPPGVTEFSSQELGMGRAVPGKGRRIPSVGRPVPGLSLEIRDERGQPVQEGIVGRIFIKGPSVTPGYYRSPEITAQTFKNGWLDTGDLGFLFEGELYISGRAKDLIIIRGRNYAPQEIEELLLDVPGLRTGCAVAVSIPGDSGEELVILAERKTDTDLPDQALIESVREAVLKGISLTPSHVRILEPGTLPRTSSGKMRRSEALRMFQDEQLLAPRQGRLHLVKELARSQAAWMGVWLRKRREGDGS